MTHAGIGRWRGAVCARVHCAVCCASGPEPLGSSNGQYLPSPEGRSHRYDPTRRIADADHCAGPCLATTHRHARCAIFRLSPDFGHVNRRPRDRSRRGVLSEHNGPLAVSVRAGRRSYLRPQPPSALTRHGRPDLNRPRRSRLRSKEWRQERSRWRSSPTNLNAYAPPRLLQGMEALGGTVRQCREVPEVAACSARIRGVLTGRKNGRASKRAPMPFSAVCETAGREKDATSAPAGELRSGGLLPLGASISDHRRRRRRRLRRPQPPKEQWHLAGLSEGAAI